MKIKRKIIQMIIISLILISIPVQKFAWLQIITYEACNPVNVCISGILKMIAFIISVGYITGGIQYMKHANQEKKEKIRAVVTGAVIIITQVIFLFSASAWVTQIGMESYWSNGQRVQLNDIDGYISNSIRITALIAIIAYVITSIIYIIKSKQDEVKKLENVIKWQLIISVLVAGLLIFAKNW